MHRSICSLAALASAVLLAALASAPAAAIDIEAGFDHGSLLSWNVTGGGGRGGGTVNLVGRDNFYGGGQWRWMYFKASDVQDTRPLFATSNNFAGGASRLDNHFMVYSYDQENWSYFDNANNSGGTYSFSNDDNFTQDEVWVAYAFPYSYADSVAHTQAVLATPWAVPTSSGDANGVIGQSPGGVDDLGRTIAPRDIYGYRITDTSTDGQLDKNKVVIMTGMHAGETLGTHNYAGLVDWLVSGDPLAVEMLKTTEFFAYPTANPDGRFAGNRRATVQNPNQDPNGRWSSATWSAVPDIEVNGEAMLADVAATPGGLAVDYFVDFHSTVPTTLGGGDDFGFIEEDQFDDLSPFWQALLQLQPNVGQVDSTSIGPTSANFADWELNAEVDVTFETQFGFTRPLEYYYDLGENFGRAFAEGFGITLASDFDEDGDVDIDDIDLLLANLGDPAFDLTGNGITNNADVTELIENILGTAFGDANLDQQVNTADLAILAANFEDPTSSWAQADYNGDGIVNTADLAQLAANFGFDGTGAVLANAALVPEPGTLALLMTGAVFVTRRRSIR
ncbi:MAG: M14 family zinc carboxypeptidase [Planctomycetota bacterium]